MTQRPVDKAKDTLLFFTIHANGIIANVCNEAISPSIKPPKTNIATTIFQNDNDMTQLKGYAIAKYMIPVYNGVYTIADKICPKYFIFSPPLKSRNPFETELLVSSPFVRVLYLLEKTKEIVCLLF